MATASERWIPGVATLVAAAFLTAPLPAAEADAALKSQGAGAEQAHRQRSPGGIDQGPQRRCRRHQEADCRRCQDDQGKRASRSTTTPPTSWAASAQERQGPGVLRGLYRYAPRRPPSSRAAKAGPVVRRPHRPLLRKEEVRQDRQAVQGVPGNQGRRHRRSPQAGRHGADDPVAGPPGARSTRP